MADSDFATRPTTSGLRLLLACPACELQFDPGQREPGTTFHCGCGTLITVPRELKTLEDSAVIRCSSCGGPKRGSGDLCRFCGARFTIHERDLDTICPQCVARISRKARFCHHCGVSITPNRLKESATLLNCPGCADSKLNSRQLGQDGATVLECSICGGLWLGHEAFALLQKRARTRELPWLNRLEEPSAPERVQSQGSRLYRNCCVCGKHMSRRNFAQRSGVILDICPADGIWFDQGELEQILKKIQSGELSRASRDAQEREREREVLKRVKRSGDPLDRAGAEEFGTHNGETARPDFLRGVISFLLDG